MKQMSEKTYWVLNKTIVAITAFILLFLLYYSAFYSHMFPKDYLEWEHVVQDPVYFHFFFAVFGVLFACLIEKMVKTAKAKWIVCGFLLVVYAVFCAWYVFDGTTFSPTGDQFFLCENAALFLDGNYDGVVGGGYLAQYPYQLGLTWYIEAITAIAGPHTYMVLIAVNMAALLFMGLVGIYICEGVFGKQTPIYYMLLLVGMFPLYFYISFIYGECLSMLFSMVFIWQLSRYLENKKGALLAMCLAGFAAVVFRANSMIVLIAVVILLGMQYVVKHKKSLLLAALLSVIFVFAGRELIQMQYEARSGYEIGDGIPATGWIAMGMQEGVRGNGWYSEYGVEIFEQSGYQTQLANEVALDYIRGRIREFTEHPDVAWQFYREKILSQWNEPSYQALLVLNAGVDHSNISKMKQEIMFGKYYDGILQYMNLLQTFLYAMAFISAVYLLFKKGKPVAYLFHLIFLGGFLFQILWEAKSRYVLFYMIVTLPLCAMGISVVCEYVRRGVNKIFAK